MKRIVGVNMNAITQLSGKISEKKSNNKYEIYKSLEESIKEVKLIKAGKIKPKTWDKLYEELKQKEN